MSKDTNAPGSAATVELSTKDRIFAIRANVNKLRHAPPAGWSDWSANRTSAFRDACLLLMVSAKITDALPHAQLIAKEYGVSMASIDPCHGRAA